MKTIIKSDSLLVTVNSFGAELNSIKCDDIEYLWQADSNVWARHAPILFPFISSPKDKTYHYKGEKYTVNSNHGFARDSDFEIVESTETSVTYTLTESAQTLKQYPFKFILSVKYAVIGRTINVKYAVVNTGETEMFFYLGGHPAFNCPIEEDSDFANHIIEFSHNENIVQKVPITGDRKILEDSKIIKLSHKLFDFDVILKDKPNSNSVTLCSKNSDKKVCLDFENSGCLGIWSAVGKSDFVCLEPWATVPTDFDDEFINLEEKPNAKKLAPGEEFVFNYKISV